jgi:hypothetical protein
MATDSRRIHVTRKKSRFILGLILAAAGYACTATESDLFAPEPIDATRVPDVDAPVFTAIKPAPGVTVLNSNTLSFSLADPPGASGVPSGIDDASVLARLANGIVIPLTASASTYTGSFASLNDGVVSLTLSAKDKLGNSGSAALNFTLDRTAPLIGFTTTPPAQAESSEDSLLLAIAGTIGDAAFSSGQLTVTQPGADGICGTADDVLWPKGNSAGQVSENTFDLTSQVQANGRFSSSFFAYNIVASGNPAQTAVYCGSVVAIDAAKDENGVAKGNRGTATSRGDVTWSR